MPGSTHRPTPAPLRIRVAPQDVTLSVWGLRDLGWYGWLNLLLAGGVSYGVAWITGLPWAGWIALAVLLATLWRFWLPTRYELGPQGISQTVLGRTSRIPWTAILNYEIRPRGVMLYADAVLTPLSAVRGLYLPWGSQREQVLGHVEYYLTTWTRGERSTDQG
jgi:hypothetical protein